MNDGLLFALAGGLIGGALASIYDRVKLRRFIRLFERLQQLHVTPIQYREVDDIDSEPLFARITQRQTEELAQHGMKLGDVAMLQAEIPGALRVFVDEARTTLIYIQALDSSTEISVESYTDDAELQTRTGTPSRWVHPPFHFVQTLPASTSVHDLLDAHRGFVMATPHSVLLRFDSLTDVIRAWVKIHDDTIAWRTAQSPDELLEGDLRLLLGAEYERVWPRVRKRLRTLIPRAEARPR